MFPEDEIDHHMATCEEALETPDGQPYDNNDEWVEVIEPMPAPVEQSPQALQRKPLLDSSAEMNDHRRYLTHKLFLPSDIAEEIVQYFQAIQQASLKNMGLPRDSSQRYPYPSDEKLIENISKLRTKRQHVSGLTPRKDKSDIDMIGRYREEMKRLQTRMEECQKKLVLLQQNTTTLQRHISQPKLKPKPKPKPKRTKSTKKKPILLMSKKEEKKEEQKSFEHSHASNLVTCDGTECGSEIGQLIHPMVQHEVRNRVCSIDHLKKVVDKIELESKEAICVYWRRVLKSDETWAKEYLPAMDWIKANFWEYLQALQQTKNEKLLRKMKIILSVLHSKPEWNVNKLIDIISSPDSFFNHNSKLRKHVKILLQKEQDKVFCQRNQQLLNNLKRKEYYVYSLFECQEILEFFEDCLPKHKHHLYAICNSACGFSGTGSVIVEIARNWAQEKDIGFRLKGTKHHMKVLRKVKKHPYYKILSNTKDALTDDEILAIYYYTCIGGPSKKLREAYRGEQVNNCRWRRFYQTLLSGILKIYYGIVMNAVTLNGKVKMKIPHELYHGCPVTWDESSQEVISMKCVTSTSSDPRVSQMFAGEGVIFTLQNIAPMLEDGRLKAAPVAWISANDHEEEWLLAPVEFTRWTQKGDKYDGFDVTVTDYESPEISFLLSDISQSHNSPQYSLNLDLETWLKSDPTNNKYFVLQVVFALFSSLPCDQCGITSRSFTFEGDLMQWHLECPACRRYLFNIHCSEDEVIACMNHKCLYKGKRRNFAFDREELKRDINKSGVKCPECGVGQKKARYDYMGKSEAFHPEIQKYLDRWNDTLKAYYKRDIRVDLTVERIQKCIHQMLAMEGERLVVHNVLLQNLDICLSLAALISNISNDTALAHILETAKKSWLAIQEKKRESDEREEKSDDVGVIVECVANSVNDDQFARGLRDAKPLIAGGVAIARHLLKL